MSQIWQADDVIIGGGAAGLSLASALLRRDGGKRKILVVEPRQSYVRDRTWCFWSDRPTAHDDVVTHRWRKWRVRADGMETVVASQRYEYCHVPADAYYRKLLGELDDAANAEVRLNSRVGEIRDLHDGAIMTTDRGNVVANRVFDSRPCSSGRTGVDRHIDLQQHFMGWHVKAPDAAFDPEVVTLMDFKTRTDDQIQFFYVLPFSETEALVEATFISRSALPDDVYEAEIRSYLREVLGVDRYDVQWTESGRIPMTTRPHQTRPSRHVYAIGGAAGLVKPSTGYAFLAIQKFSEAFAARLAARPLPRPPRARPAILKALDRVFLAVIDRCPAIAPAIFAGLFRRVEPDALVRFLTDTPTPRDIVAVVRAMPTWLFLRQAIVSASIWLRP